MSQGVLLCVNNFSASNAREVAYTPTTRSNRRILNTAQLNSDGHNGRIESKVKESISENLPGIGVETGQLSFMHVPGTPLLLNKSPFPFHRKKKNIKLINDKGPGNLQRG